MRSVCKSHDPRRGRGGPWLAVVLAITPCLAAQDRRLEHTPIVQSFLNDAKLVGRNLFQIDFDAETRTVFVAASDGLYRYDGYRWNHLTEELPSEFVRSVWVDSESRELWVGTDKGIAILSLPDLHLLGTVVEELAGPNVRRIRRGRNGTIWICSDRWLVGADAPSGLTCYESATRQWTKFTKRDGLPDEYVMDFFVDRVGNSWALTNNGLARFDRGVFTPFLHDLEGNDRDQRFWSMADGPHGRVLAATRHALYDYENGQWRKVNGWEFDNPQLLLRKDGQLLMPRPMFKRMLFLKVDQIEDGRQKFLPDFVPFPFAGPQRVEQIVAGPDDSIWLVGRNVLLRWIQPGSDYEPQWRTYSRSDNPKFQIDQTLWIATDEGFRRSAHGMVEAYARPDPNAAGTLPVGTPEGVVVSCLWRDDRENRTWVGTNHGLFEHHGDETELRPLVTRPGHHVHGVVKIGREIWFARQDESDGRLALCRYSAGKTKVFPLRVRRLLGTSLRGEAFFEAEGGLCILPGAGEEPYLLKIPHSFSVSAVARADDGVLWFDVQTGWLSFTGDGSPPETTCRAPKTISEGDPLIVEVDVVEWMTPPDLGRSYSVSTRLNGEEWTPYSILRNGEIRIDGIPTGDHVLQVRARDEGLDEDGTPAEIRFTVVRPGPALWPFFLGGLALVAFGSFAGVRLRRRNARLETFRQLLRKTGSAILSVDHEGVVTDANREGMELLGLTAADLGVRRLLDCVEDREVGERLWNKLRARGTIEELECDLAAGDGEVATVVLSAVQSTGSRAGAVGYRLLLQDITSSRAIERQLRHAQKMEGVGLLAGGIAHDFNNMLCGIMGHADLIMHKLQQENGDPELKEYAESILDTSRWASKLTGQLLAFSRRGVVRSKPVDIHQIIDQIHKLLLRTIDRRIEMEVDLAADFSTVDGDPSQLHSALLNLAINARDALPDGGRISIRSSLEELSGGEPYLTGPAIEPGEFLRVSVVDTGLGIAREDLKRIFEPFFTTKEVGRGTGMGLAAVYGTVVAHRGTISVESQLGHGTTMDVFLPLARDVEVPADEPTAGIVSHDRGTILVADDEYVVRTFVENALGDSGYAIISATDGQEALDLFTAHQHEIDLVVLDMIMPSVSGRDAMARILESDSSARVLIVTGHVQDETVHDLIRDGAAEVLQKPFSRDELLAGVNAAWPPA